MTSSSHSVRTCACVSVNVAYYDVMCVCIFLAADPANPGAGGIGSGDHGTMTSWANNQPDINAGSNSRVDSHLVIRCC